MDHHRKKQPFKTVKYRRNGKKLGTSSPQTLHSYGETFTVRRKIDSPGGAKDLWKGHPAGGEMKNGATK